MTIKYSIVIPTRNRGEYLPYAIKSVLDSPRDDIELIVSNNFSTDNTSEILSKITDPRLKVVGPNLSLPMAGHYEFAISHAKGKWITILGDDDAVMPYIFETLDKHIKKYPQIDIISSVRSYFFWKGCEDLYGDIVVNYTSKQKTKIRSTKKDLMLVLKGLKSCFDMPQLYTTCIIKRSLYKEIKTNSNGCFYHSIIPDMYSIVAICLSRDEYLRLEEPLFWVGTSNRSLGRSDRIYKDAEQFKNKNLSENKCVPKKISDKVSYLLHSNKFSSMYIFECLLQSPLKKQLFSQDNIRNIVLSSILFMSRNRKKIEKDLIINEILLECKCYDISYKNLYLTSYYLRLNKLIMDIIKFIERFFIKTKIKSSNRIKFPTILDASILVTNIVKKNKFEKIEN